MKNSRTILKHMKRTAFLALIAGVWSCEAMSEPSESEPEGLTQACAEGTELAIVGVGDDAAEVCKPISEIRVVGCPAGAKLLGDAPPRAARQRCEQDKNVRHGASREWYDSGRERTLTEWWQGAKHGKFTLWYPNGQVRAQGAHLHGQPAGEWVYFAEDGKVLQRRSFDAAPPAEGWLAEAIAGRPPTTRRQ